MDTPTLSGAEHGRVRCQRAVPGGLWIFDADGNLTNVACALRIVRQRDMVRCEDYARQFLAQRGDKTVTASSMGSLTTLLFMHLALIPPSQPGVPTKPIYGLPDDLADSAGKLNARAVAILPLWDLADGQLERLLGEYNLLLATETPPTISHEQWQKIVNEGKSESLKTLILRHGSSALIQVLHGTDAAAWQV